MLTYADPYLRAYATPEREERALDDVLLHGTFNEDWLYRLQVLRVYIIICTESLQSADDTFSVKLKQYHTEWKRALDMAKTDALNVTEQDAVNLYSIPVERA
jgi:transcriptional regulator with PAS, ATPase and Fis domain